MVLKAATNIQLTNIAYKMGLPLNDILMRDEMNELKDGGFYIINLDTSNNNGTHWTALYFHPLQSYYCERIKPFLYNDKDIQDFNSEACGYYCLAFIKFLYDKNDKELAFKEFLKMFGKKTIENDNILQKYLDID